MSHTVLSQIFIQAPLFENFHVGIVGHSFDIKEEKRSEKKKCYCVQSEGHLQSRYGDRNTSLTGSRGPHLTLRGFVWQSFGEPNQNCQVLELCAFKVA